MNQTEPKCLMSFLLKQRNSHWHSQSVVGLPQAIKNGSGPDSTFTGRFDEDNIHSNSQNPMESDPRKDASGKGMDQQTELANKSLTMPMPLQASIPAYVQGDGVLVHPLDRPVSDKESAECPTTSDTLNQNEELMIEGGTINFSSAYSQGLLNALTQALQSSGVDLSQATISVQIDLGKRANRGLTSGLSVVKDHEKPQSGSNQQVGHFREVNNGEDADQARKKLKI